MNDRQNERTILFVILCCIASGPFRHLSRMRGTRVTRDRMANGPFCVHGDGLELEYLTCTTGIP